MRAPRSLRVQKRRRQIQFLNDVVSTQENLLSIARRQLDVSCLYLDWLKRQEQK